MKGIIAEAKIKDKGSFAGLPLKKCKTVTDDFGGVLSREVRSLSYLYVLSNGYEEKLVTVFYKAYQKVYFSRCTRATIGFALSGRIKARRSRVFFAIIHSS